MCGVWLMEVMRSKWKRNMAQGHWETLNGQQEAQVPFTEQACLGLNASPSNVGSVQGSPVIFFKIQ